MSGMGQKRHCARISQVFPLGLVVPSLFGFREQVVEMRSQYFEIETKSQYFEV